MRLDRFLSSQTDLSRKDAKAVLRQGMVSVNGAVCKDPATAVDPNADTIAVGGNPLTFQEHLYLMLHKPEGYVSATEDRNRPTVLELVPPELYRDGLFPAGRLDADTRRRAVTKARESLRLTAEQKEYLRTLRS